MEARFFDVDADDITRTPMDDIPKGLIKKVCRAEFVVPLFHFFSIFIERPLLFRCSIFSGKNLVVVVKRMTATFTDDCLLTLFAVKRYLEDV